MSNFDDFDNDFDGKINTALLLYLYQIFIFLLSHLQFFLHFFFTLMENLFKKHPIPLNDYPQKSGVRHFGKQPVAL